MRQAMTWEVAAPALVRGHGGGRQKALLGGGAGLVPLLAATGLALPLPAQIYRLAEFVIQRTAAIADVLPGVERDAPTAHHPRGVAPTVSRAQATARIALAGRVQSSRVGTRQIGSSHEQGPHGGRTGTPASSVSVPTRSRAPEPTASASRGEGRTTQPSTQTATTTSVSPAAAANADAAPAQSEPAATARRDQPAPAPAPEDPVAPSPEPTDKPATVSVSATVSATASTSPVVPTQTGATASTSLTASSDPVSATVTVGIGLKR
jgi:hypothetical protein